ncbi:MAG: hypothetical protein WC454_09530 [Phycisphaerae bacterium]
MVPPAIMMRIPLNNWQHACNRQADWFLSNGHEEKFFWPRQVSMHTKETRRSGPEAYYEYVEDPTTTQVTQGGAEIVSATI